MSSFALIFAIAISLSNTLAAQPASRKDFEELSEKMAGRWVGKVIWVADWPEVGGKRGDEVTAPFHVRREGDCAGPVRVSVFPSKTISLLPDLFVPSGSFV